MNSVLAALAFLLFSSTAIAQDAPQNQLLERFLEDKRATGELSADESRQVSTAIRSIDQGNINSSVKKLYVLDGDTVWVREIPLPKENLSSSMNEITMDVDEGIRLEVNRTVRIGGNNINVRSIKLRPGAVGFVAGAAGAAAAVCVYVGGCSGAELGESDDMYVPVE